VRRRVAGIKQILLMIAVVVLVGGCGESKEEKAAKAEAKAAAEAKVGAWVSDPSDPINVKIEAAIRRAAKKPTGKLTKADLEKVTELKLSYKQLTEVPKGLEKLTQLTVLDISLNKLTDVKGLEKLTKLTFLSLYGNNLTSVKGLEKLTLLTELWLRDNPDPIFSRVGLTKAQIAELQKALPKCIITSNPKE
jgi:Leucine-rich repeat (LRR) protein